jgi:hypothetical protein
MSDEIDAKYEVFQDLLETRTPEEAVKSLEVLGLQDDVIQRIRDRHEQRVIEIREMDEPRVVYTENRYTWYTGPRSGDKCWPAIVDRLAASGWKQDPAIDSLDAASTKVVSLLSHPKERAFSTRGLVVGYVQSGKTTNFTAVMAKAADRGYKLFIVLAGIHNGLRRQTQARLVQQLITPNPTKWAQLTDLDRDFVPTANAASFFGKSNRTHVLCVVKKNATVLRKFAEWLRSASDYLGDCPALVIDDEADQATVATKTINPLIRDILGILPKSAYVGYTASPFANLLIDPSSGDLYPSDFIVNLPKPVGHFGTEVVFGRYALDGEDPEDVDDGYDMIRTVPDSDIEIVRPLRRVDIDAFEPQVTPTLRTAVEYFWLSTAARRIRGSGVKHSTMLIHTSVNTVVHNRFRKPLEDLRRDLRAQLHSADMQRGLRSLWDSESSRVSAAEFGEHAISFNQLLVELPGVIDDCKIIMDNSSSEDRLDYESGPVVAIAVGGNTLSRGLTLEGLSVSYFVRAVSAYDTLLQMGRWFGYRDGYADLPRIWMTDELKDWFRHLSTVETEMRRDIDLYMTEDKDPLTFAVRLRTHPALRVTAAAKMKDAVPAWSAYGGHRVQTRYFRRDHAWLKKNQDAARKLIADTKASAMHEPDAKRGRHIFRDVPSEHVIDFLRQYQFHEKSQECDSDLITRYIKRRRDEAGSLAMWNVAIVGNPVDSELGNFDFGHDVQVGRIVRARLGSEDDGLDEAGEDAVADIKTLMSRRDAAIDLSGETGKLTELQIKEQRLRQLPKTGLIVLYPIHNISKPAEGRKFRAALNAKTDVIGVGLVFPQPSVDSPIEKDYISADLSRIDIEEEDFEALNAEETA